MCHCEEERRSNLKTGIASLSLAMTFNVNLFNTFTISTNAQFYIFIMVTDYPHLNLSHQGGGIQGYNEHSPPPGGRG